VATDVGGGYDTSGRLVAEFMQKHLPGSTFVVRNMPGAGHLIGTNYLYASEPDGLTIGTFNTGLIYSQLVGEKSVRFDLTKMSWIGKAAAEPRVLLVSTQSGINSFEDLKNSKTRLVFSASGVGSAAHVETTLLIKALDLPVEVVTGFSGDEDQLSMRRGEVQGILGSKSSFDQFIKDGYAKFIAQIGGSATDIPQLSSFVDNEAGIKAIALIQAQATMSRLTAAPPGVPEDRLAALRDAYAAATSDPEYLERAAKAGIPVAPLVGEDVAKAVTHALDQTPEMIEVLKGVIEP
jgi:tripartite-type tricarboxylate transporter receptor subunit TctC